MLFKVNNTIINLDAVRHVPGIVLAYPDIVLIHLLGYCFDLPNRDCFSHTHTHVYHQHIFPSKVDLLLFLSCLGPVVPQVSSHQPANQLTQLDCLVGWLTNQPVVEGTCLLLVLSHATTIRVTQFPKQWMVAQNNIMDHRPEIIFICNSYSNYNNLYLLSNRK